MIRQQTLLNSILELLIINRENLIENISIGTHTSKKNSDHNVILFIPKLILTLIIGAKLLLNFKFANFDLF